MSGADGVVGVDRRSPLDGAAIVLAVTGGVAAYKAVELCSTLVQAGAAVDVVMSRAARRFVRPLLFNAITHRPVHASAWVPWTEDEAGHVTLAHRAEALVVAPATANTIGRLALGLADDLLGNIALATPAPLLLAPAMEHNMWHHPAVQGHLQTLRSRGAVVVEPEPGRLASGMSGDGRLAPVAAIVGRLRVVLARTGPLAGRRVVVTAGPTQEPLDPVRFVGNRSSGRMGFALAQALLERGAAVHLVAGPVDLAPPEGAEVTRVETALEMLAATSAATADADALIMTAAVADFRPEMASDHKIKKESGVDELEVRLIRNPDIIAAIDRPGLVKVGFAAETDDLIANAAIKLRAKGLAMIVANDAVGTIGGERSTATLLWPDRPAYPLPELSKPELAARIADELVALLAERSGTTA